MRPPHEDMPSTESDACDIGGCCEPWAAEVALANGPRRLRLCEEHHDRWTSAERALDAEREEMRGREDLSLRMAPVFGLATTFWGPVRGRRAG